MAMEQMTIPYDFQEKLTKYIAQKYIYEPEDINKIVTTSNNNKIIFLEYKNFKPKKAFFCDKPMAIDEIKNLTKEFFTEWVDVGYKTREICTGIDEYNKTVGESKKITKIISFHYDANFYVNSCDCFNDYIGLTDDCEAFNIQVSSLANGERLDEKITSSIINF